MIYKEYCSVTENCPLYSNGGNDMQFSSYLGPKLAQGWEIISSFVHTHLISNGKYSYDPSSGSQINHKELQTPLVTFILGRNEAADALYGKNN